MTSFIQMWDTKRLPASIRKLLPDYSGQDVVFVPRDTPQKFEIIGDVQSDLGADSTVFGFDYQIEPGYFRLGTNLKVTIR